MKGEDFGLSSLLRLSVTCLSFFLKVTRSSFGGLVSLFRRFTRLSSGNFIIGHGDDDRGRL